MRFTNHTRPLTSISARTYMMHKPVFSQPHTYAFIVHRPQMQLNPALSFSSETLRHIFLQPNQAARKHNMKADLGLCCCSKDDTAHAMRAMHALTMHTFRVEMLQLAGTVAEVCPTPARAGLHPHKYASAYATLGQQVPTQRYALA